MMLTEDLESQKEEEKQGEQALSLQLSLAFCLASLPCASNVLTSNVQEVVNCSCS